MAASPKLYKAFTNFLGLDLRSSDLLREKGAATELENMVYRDTGAMSKRKGFQYKIRGDQTALSNGYVSNGLFKWDDVDQNTGAITEKLIGVGTLGWLKSEEELTLTYSGSGSASYTLKLNPVTSEFEMILSVDGDVTNTIDLGTGRLPSDLAISQLGTAINALTDWALSAPVSVGAEKAAFLPIKIQQIVATTTPITVSFWSKLAMPGTYADPFALHVAKENELNFENASFADLNNVLYISNGYDVLHKYDGTRLYKAGLPAATIVSVVEETAGVATVYDYKATYEYTDAKGNFIEGITSGVVTANNNAAIGASPNSVTITVDDLGATSGYDTNSTNLKVNLWRTIDYTGSVPGLFYQVESKANTVGTSLVFTDVTVDADLQDNLQFVDPIKEHGLPPLGKYLAVVGNQLIISGKVDQSRTTFYSDIDSPEYFPAGDNAFDVNASVTGIGNLGNTLFVFKNTSISSVTGSLPDDNFAVDEASQEGIGCSAYHTIQEVGGTLWFLSPEGVYSISNEGLTPLSESIKPKFITPNNYAFKQAVAINWTKEDKYVLFIPTLSQATGNRISSDDDTSDIFVYDYFRKSWLKWNMYNMMGGAAVLDNELWKMRRVTNPTANPDSQISKVLNEATEQDYADHENAITFTYATHWEALNDPSVWKKFLRIKVHSIDTSLDTFESDAFTLTITGQVNYLLDNVSSITMDFSGGSEGWGIGPWGEFRWGESRLLSLKNKLASSKVKAHRLTFQNTTTHENVLISGYELELVTPYNTMIKE